MVPHVSSAQLQALQAQMQHMQLQYSQLSLQPAIDTSSLSAASASSAAAAEAAAMQAAAAQATAAAAQEEAAALAATAASLSERIVELEARLAAANASVAARDPSVLPEVESPSLHGLLAHTELLAALLMPALLALASLGWRIVPVLLAYWAAGALFAGAWLWFAIYGGAAGWLVYQGTSASPTAQLFRRRMRVYGAALVAFLDYRLTKVAIASAGYDAARDAVKLEAIYDAAHRRNAVRAFRVIRDLRGLWVKCGQYLSSRPDVMPQPYIDILASLQVSSSPLTCLRPAQCMLPDYCLSPIAILHRQPLQPTPCIGSLPRRFPLTIACIGSLPRRSPLPSPAGRHARAPAVRCEGRHRGAAEAAHGLRVRVNRRKGAGSGVCGPGAPRPPAGRHRRRRQGAGASWLGY